MIRLGSKNLTDSVQDTLDELQSRIDSQTTFAKKTEKAQSLWTTKGGASGKVVFKNLSHELYDLCVYVGVCNYCEQSEANDIEHIYPKSFFPEYTFVWTNYILACKQCNSGLKLDKAYVLDDNDDLIELIRTQEPPFNRIAFINIRTEDPFNFLILNPLSHKFEVLPNLIKADENKAKATLKILELNERDLLVAGRNSAARHYYETLDRLCRILSAATPDELRARLTPNDNLFDFKKDMLTLKTEIKDSYEAYISNYQHPSVWHTIKIVQSKVDAQWKALFNQIPEALLW